MNKTGLIIVHKHEESCVAEFEDYCICIYGCVHTYFYVGYIHKVPIVKPIIDRVCVCVCGHLLTQFTC